MFAQSRILGASLQLCFYGGMRTGAMSGLAQESGAYERNKNHLRLARWIPVAHRQLGAPKEAARSSDVILFLPVRPSSHLMFSFLSLQATPVFEPSHFTLSAAKLQTREPSKD